MKNTDNLIFEKSEVLRRPKPIAILCWLIFILFPVTTIISFFMFGENEKVSKFHIEQADIVNSILIGIPIFIGAIGLYRMKKWGAWVYIGAQTIGAFISFSQAAKYKAIIQESPFTAFIIPGLCIGIVLYYYKYFTDNTAANPITATETSTTKPSNVDLLNKLEQLHRMKEEGKLSDEEYSLLKNKVMSALTGKVIEIKSESKKAEEEILTNKSKDESTAISLNQSDNKQSEDSGILGKLEQLHQMKEEGKLSDEEYNLMKNKVMSALTGKVVETKPEPNKIEDEVLTNKSHEENSVNPLTQPENKQSEDSGILEKLEHLHKMKMEGILSEEEYNDMKNNIISAIPGSKESSVSEINKTEEKKVKPVVSNEISHKNYLSDVKATKNISSDNEKIQISKKLIYGSVALLLLVAAFVLIYPKYSEEDDAGINKLVNYFSDENQNKENNNNGKSNFNKNKLQKAVIENLIAKDESVNNCGFSGGEYPKISGLNDEKFQEKLNGILRNNVDEFKKIIKGEVSENLGDVNGFMDFEVLTNNDTLITIIQRTNWVVCGANGYGFDAYVLNADINSNRILTNDDMNIKSIELNKYNTIVYDFFKRQDLIYGNAKNPHSIMDYYPGNPDNFDYIPVVKSFEELNKYKFGYKNGKLVLIETAMPSSRASLSVYIIPMNFPSNTTSDETVASLSTEQVHGSDNASGLKENKTYGNASDIVKSWIESLGKRDFETAYNLMSPSLSKSYAVFTSPNRYGGITKTKVHSVETVSSSGCNYVVVATYDSYDPSNRDGKFTERFNVNNCYNYWQITNIKNISTEYFR